MRIYNWRGSKSEDFELKRPDGYQYFKLIVGGKLRGSFHVTPSEEGIEVFFTHEFKLSRDDHEIKVEVE